MSLFNKIFILAVFCFPILVLSQETEKKENNKDKEYSGSQNEFWLKAQADISSLKSKIDAQQKSVDEILVNQKANAKNSDQEQRKNLIQKHKELLEMIKNYNKKLNDFEIKYPEKGIEIGRTYQRKKKQSIDQIENQLTLEGRIKKLNKTINSQFQAYPSGPVKPKENVSEKPHEALPSEIIIKKKPKNDVTDKLIIVK